MREGKNAKLSLSAGRRLIKKLSFKNVFDGAFEGLKKKRGKILLDMVGEPVYIESNMAGKDLADLLTHIEYKLIAPEVSLEKLSVKVIGAGKLEIGLYNDLSSEVKGKVSIECQGKTVIDSKVSLDGKERKTFPIKTSSVNNFEKISLKISFLQEGKSEPEISKDVSFVLLTSKKRKSPITIDGDLCGWGKGYSISLPERFKDFGAPAKFASPIPWKGKEDLSGMMYTSWDENNFYLAVKIKDDVFTRPPRTDGAYLYDNLQVYLDTVYDARDGDRSKRYHENVYNYNFSALKEGLRATRDCAPDGNTGPVSEVRCAFRETKDGMIYEIAFPLKQIFPISLKEGSSFGFAILINDNDNDYRKRGLTLTPKGTEPHISAHLYPVMCLQ